MTPPRDSIVLVVGLGNPGAEYEGTRHNVGAAAVARLAAIMKIRMKRSFLLGAWVGKKGKVTLARPNAWMNLSGPPVKRLARACRTSAPLIVSDDLDLPLGSIRFRTKGSPGGHRGLASIVASLGTSAFPRLKIGIGRPPGEAKDYVLGKFAPEERETCENAINRAAEALRTALTLGLDRAMTVYSE